MRRLSSGTPKPPTAVGIGSAVATISPIAAQLFEACTGSNPDPWSVMQRMFDAVIVEVESRTVNDMDALDFIGLEIAIAATHR
jgi:hypothetical protein